MLTYPNGWPERDVIRWHAFHEGFLRGLLERMPETVAICNDQRVGMDLDELHALVLGGCVERFTVQERAPIPVLSPIALFANGRLGILAQAGIQTSGDLDKEIWRIENQKWRSPLVRQAHLPRDDNSAKWALHINNDREAGQSYLMSLEDQEAKQRGELEASTLNLLRAKAYLDYFDDDEGAAKTLSENDPDSVARLKSFCAYSEAEIEEKFFYNAFGWATLLHELKRSKTCFQAGLNQEARSKYAIEILEYAKLALLLYEDSTGAKLLTKEEEKPSFSDYYDHVYTRMFTFGDRSRAEPEVSPHLITPRRAPEGAGLRTLPARCLAVP